MRNKVIGDNNFSKNYRILDLNEKIEIEKEYALGTRYHQNIFESNTSLTALLALNSNLVNNGDLKVIGNKAYVLSSVTASIYQFDYIDNQISFSTPNFISRPINGVFISEFSPTAISFKSDGTKLYILGDQNNNIYQFSLSTAWDVSTISYDSKTFYVGLQEGTPTGMFFKPDGTKVYVVGSGNDTIYQYSLSTAWDVSTISYDSKTFYVGLQNSVPSGLFFKPDGTKVYISNGPTITQYSLSTAWDISTTSYDSIIYTNFISETYNDLFFKSDGTKVYTVVVGGGTGGSSSRVREFSLSTAWDISTLSTSGKYLSCLINTQHGLFFKDDGTKVFTIGFGNDRNVGEISLSTAWDITSGLTYNGIYVGNRDESPRALFFKDDGTKLYILGDQNNTIYQFSLSTAWDVTTASYDSKTFSVGTQEGAPTGMFFKPDGTKVYVLGTNNRKIFQYSLSTPWDISTASYDSISSTFYFGYMSYPKLFFNNYGTKLVVSNSNSISFLNLATAWDITTIYDDLNRLENVKSFSISGQEGNPYGMFFKDDGTKVYIVGGTSETIYQYSLSTPWDISTTSYDSKSFSVTSQDTEPEGIFFKPDGTKFYMVGLTGDGVYQYSLSTPWDISTASYDSNSFYVGTQEPNPTDLFFKPDGSVVYVLGFSGRRIYQYSLGTPWDISTATYNNATSSAYGYLGEVSPQGLFFKSDGTKAYIIGSSSNTIYEIKLQIPWDLGLESFQVNAAYRPTEFDSVSSAIFVKPDGKTFYFLGVADDKIYQLGEFTNSWDISSIKKTFLSINAPYNGYAGANSYYSFHMNDDMSKMYVGISRGIVVYDYIN